MFPHLIIVLFLFIISSPINAQVYEVPDSAAVTGVGKTFILTNSLFLNVKVVSSENIYGYVQTIDQQIIIDVDKSQPEQLSTYLTISNLNPVTTYNMIKNGIMEEITTNETGSYMCELDISLPQKMVISAL